MLVRPAAAFRDAAASGRPSLVWLALAYLLPLSLVPPLARGLGLLVFGARDARGPFRVSPFAAGLDALLAWAAILLATLLLSLAGWALCALLKAGKSLGETLTLSVYASTAGWAAGVFAAAPGLQGLVIAGELYDVVLFWLGARLYLGFAGRRLWLFCAGCLLLGAVCQILIAEGLRLLILLL